MNRPKVTEQDYINFLIATPKVCSGTEAARVHPERGRTPAHDAFTRLLHRLEPDATMLWQEAAGQVVRQTGILVVDDSTLDKPYTKKMDLVQRHWSGKHRAVVEGINWITLLPSNERVVKVVGIAWPSGVFTYTVWTSADSACSARPPTGCA